MPFKAGLAVYINVRENRRPNQEWTIQRNWRRALKKHDEDNKTHDEDNKT